MDLFMWTVKDVRRSELASPPPPPPSSYPSYGRRTEKGRIFGRKNLGLRYGILRRSVAVKMVNIKIKYVRQRVAMRVRVVKVLTDFSSCPPSPYDVKRFSTVLTRQRVNLLYDGTTKKKRDTCDDSACRNDCSERVRTAESYAAIRTAL